VFAAQSASKKFVMIPCGGKGGGESGYAGRQDLKRRGGRTIPSSRSWMRLKVQPSE